MKKDMPLEGLRWSRDSGSALYDTPQNGRSRTGWGGRFSFIIGTVIYIVSSMFNIRFIMSVSAILASYGMALILNQYMPKLFSTFRNYTYQIFLMGIFAQIAVKMITRRLVIPEYMAFIACIIAGVYFPVVISVIVQAINNKWLCLCIGLKKKV